MVSQAGRVHEGGASKNERDTEPRRGLRYCRYIANASLIQSTGQNSCMEVWKGYQAIKILRLGILLGHLTSCQYTCL